MFVLVSLSDISISFELVHLPYTVYGYTLYSSIVIIVYFINRAVYLEYGNI